MSLSETPIEPSRHLVPKLSETQEGRPPGEEFVPRYVEVPSRRPHRDRNLRWGIVALGAALLLTGVALFLAGPRALIPPLIALLTLGTLWVLARMRLFRQRSGVFLALGLVCLLGACISLLDRAYWAANSPVNTTSELPAETNPLQPTPADAHLPLLSKEFELTPPDLNSGRHGRMLKDWPVMVGRKRYLMKTGEIFPIEEVRENEVVFRVNEVRGLLPAEAIELLGLNTASLAGAPEEPGASGEAPATPEDARTTQRAQQEAVRRFPALGVQGSPENKLFLETYQDWKNTGSELLQDPEWPLLLAELLGKRESWKRIERVGE